MLFRSKHFHHNLSMFFSQPIHTFPHLFYALPRAFPPSPTPQTLSLPFSGIHRVAGASRTGCPSDEVTFAAIQGQLSVLLDPGLSWPSPSRLMVPGASLGTTVGHCIKRILYAYTSRRMHGSDKYSIQRVFSSRVGGRKKTQSQSMKTLFHLC